MKLFTIKRVVCVTFLLLGFFLGLGHVFAAKFILRDGRVIEGRMALLERVDERVGTRDFIARPIVVIDDGLRRVYLSKSQIRQVNEEQLQRLETFRTGERPNLEGKEYIIPGNYNNRTPFNQFGRRLLRVYHTGGVEHVEQAIVELNP